MTLEELLSDEPLILSIAALITAISLIINDLEWISLSRHFKRSGIFSWDARKARAASLIGIKLLPIFNRLFKFPEVLFIFAFRILLCVILFIFSGNYLYMGIICLFLVGVSIVISVRGNEGTTGADSMTIITLSAAGLCLVSKSVLIWESGLIFIACQLTLAYSTAGWIRIFQPTWRSGADLLVVLRQITYGNKTIWTYLHNRPRMAMFTSMSILIFECSAPFVLFMPFHVVIVYLSIGFLFHLSNAIFMGLNTFLWSFGATYLPYIWLALKINSMIYQ